MKNKIKINDEEYDTFGVIFGVLFVLAIYFLCVALISWGIVNGIILLLGKSLYFTFGQSCILALIMIGFNLLF